MIKPTYLISSDIDMVREMFDALSYVQPDKELEQRARDYWASRGVDVEVRQYDAS